MRDSRILSQPFAALTRVGEAVREIIEGGGACVIIIHITSNRRRCPRITRMNANAECSGWGAPRCTGHAAAHRAGTQTAAACSHCPVPRPHGEAALPCRSRSVMRRFISAIISSHRRFLICAAHTIPKSFALLASFAGTNLGTSTSVISCHSLICVHLRTSAVNSFRFGRR